MIQTLQAHSYEKYDMGKVLSYRLDHDDTVKYRYILSIIDIWRVNWTSFSAKR